MSKIANGARSAGGGCTIAAAIGVGYLSARLFSVKKKRAVSAWAVGRLGPALRFARTGIFSNFVARTMERTRAGKMGKFLFFPPNILAEPIITVLMIKC